MRSRERIAAIIAGFEGAYGAGAAGFTQISLDDLRAIYREMADGYIPPLFCPHCGGRVDEKRVIEWGGWRFDEDMHAFQLPGGAVVQLTKTEGALAGALLRSQGRTVAKDGSLYSAVCGGRPDADWPEIKMVDVMMCKIRKKVRDSSGRELCITVWGRGYAAIPYDQPQKKESAA